MQNKATTAQLSAIHAILHKRGLMAHKADMIGGITHGRTEKARELTSSEAADLIQSLQMDKAAAREDQGMLMRKHIIAMAHEMGWIGEKTIVAYGGRLKVVKDYSSLEAWLLKYGYLHKKLFAYTYKELPTLVTQFKAVYAAHLKK